MKRKCWKCRRLKPVDEFTKNASLKGGVSDTCLECNKENTEEYRKNNPLKSIEVRRKWDAVNRNEYQRNYKKNKMKQSLISFNNKLAENICQLLHIVLITVKKSPAIFATIINKLAGEIFSFVMYLKYGWKVFGSLKADNPPLSPAFIFKRHGIFYYFKRHLIKL